MDNVIQFRGTIYENGYGLIAAKVMRDKSIPKQSRLIYAYMCSFASMDKNGERVAFPSVSLQCEELDMTKDTYYKHRKVLEVRGLITIETRRDSGKFVRNLYFIEAVPVPKETDSEPCPKNSDTVKSDTEKSETNIISSNIISSNNKSTNTPYIDSIDDDKRTSPSGEGSAVHNEEHINLLISNFREATKDELTDRSFKSVVRKVVDKYNQGLIVGNFRDYLATSLNNKIEELDLRRQKDNAKAQIRESARKRAATTLNNLAINPSVPFYNWLES